MDEVSSSSDWRVVTDEWLARQIFTVEIVHAFVPKYLPGYRRSIYPLYIMTNLFIF